MLPRLLLMKRPPYSPSNTSPRGDTTTATMNRQPRVVVRTCNGTELRDFGAQASGSTGWFMVYSLSLPLSLSLPPPRLALFLIFRLA